MITNHASRRRFIAGLAGIGASTLLSRAAGAAAQSNGPRRIIDVHHHILPPKFIAQYRKEIGEMGPGINQVFDWTPKVSLDQMDQAGVATSIVSLNVPGSWFGNVQDGRRVSREVNEYAATMCKDHPGRFGFLAALPLADIEGSLKEIEYAFDTLRADGIGIMTSYDTMPPGLPKFAPVFDELNRRKAIVLMHRRAASCCINLRQVEGNMEFVIDDFRAMNSLLTGGTLARCADVRFIHAHGEQVLPYLSKHAGGGRGNPPWAPQGVLNELQKVYIDSAGNNKFNMDEMRELGTLSTRVMFGTDVPYGTVAANVQALRTQMGMTPAEIRAVEYETAQRLFPKYKV
jgi:predicted TIM-barrel fold metal-dependent hydrolase